MTELAPPPLPPLPERTASGVRTLIAGTLILCLALFRADAVVSLADDSLIRFFDVRLLSSFRALVYLLSFVLAVAVYALLGLTPSVPKRFFLPLVLFGLAAQLVALPVLIFLHVRSQMTAWVLSLNSEIFRPLRGVKSKSARFCPGTTTILPATFARIGSRKNQIACAGNTTTLLTTCPDSPPQRRGMPVQKSACLAVVPPYSAAR